MIEVIDERAGFYTSRTTRQREGVEFWLAKGDSREYHQVKRQQSATGR